MRALKVLTAVKNLMSYFDNMILSHKNIPSNKYTVYMGLKMSILDVDFFFLLNFILFLIIVYFSTRTEIKTILSFMFE